MNATHFFFAGPPDPPTDVKLVGVTVPNAKTVSVKVSWTPGYSGGFPQQFSIHYRKKGSNGDFIEEYVGNPPNYTYTIKGLSPNTEYEFMVQATNEGGKSQTSAKAQVATPGKKCPCIGIKQPAGNSFCYQCSFQKKEHDLR